MFSLRTSVCLLILSCILYMAPSLTSGARRRSGRNQTKVSGGQNESVGHPLILTPYILNGKVEEGREMSRVSQLVSGCPNMARGSHHNDLEVESYSGYLTVNSQLNSNLFFWFVPALKNREKAPLMLWLNGGPGTTSMVAFFNEHGPYVVDEHLRLKKRTVSWTSSNSIIYMDSPVGAGFSFTDHENGYPVGVEDVARDLHLALTQFFLIFPEFRSNDFYITGESYAGKYAPALGQKIHEANHHLEENKGRVNFKGIAIGSGFIDPISQLNYADFYYQFGLIDENENDYFQQQEQLTRDFIEAKNWTQAFIVLESLIVGYPTPYGTSHFEKITGLKYGLNILRDESPKENSYFVRYLHQNCVKRALHVGNRVFQEFNPKVYNGMSEDIYQSVKPQLTNLLNANYKVLLFASQLDGIVPYTTINSLVNSLNWRLFDDFSKTERMIWRVGSRVAGYKKKVGNFLFIMLRDCGHLAAQDQPHWTLDMINKFTKDEL